MEKGYFKFLIQVSKAYRSVSFSRLSEMIDAGEFKDGLDEKQYDIAKRAFYNFFEEHSKSASTRIFGIGKYEKRELVKKLEKELLNTALQRA